jgi:hypothetical protein
LTLSIVCDRCGERLETKLAMQHWCRRLTEPDAEALIDKFLDDLSQRSGFTLTPELRKMIRLDWITLVRQVLQ